MVSYKCTQEHPKNLSVELMTFFAAADNVVVTLAMLLGKLTFNQPKNKKRNQHSKHEKVSRTIFPGSDGCRFCTAKPFAHYYDWCAS
jgi:hypothetical protein